MHEMRYERDRGRPPGEEQEEGPTADNGGRGDRIDLREEDVLLGHVPGRHENARG